MRQLANCLNEDRAVSDRPKLIFLGRYESTEIAESWLELSGSGLKCCKMEVPFFGKDAAWDLIKAYANLRAKQNAAYRHHPDPVRRLIQAYFKAIESALGVSEGSLWNSDQGKAFAGYDGRVWFEADQISSPPRLRINVDGAQVGWGGQFEHRYPWKDFVATLAPPYAVVPDDPLSALVGECARRLPPAGTLTLNPDFSVPADDPRVRWIDRQFTSQFPQLIKYMIDYGIASSEPMDASGRGKVRIRLEFKWGDLSAAFENPDRTPRLTKFINDVRHSFGA